ncbi:hypothetical protein [Massilia sp. CF038]|uniref:hypothetical protein n=1 Tax=Massilia sp. CF038 TaxID=1881045 RepID=UPI00091D214F|nr:hypothetical protein [Massilia sp. CF038]SHH61604.1 hypothetical protein SAMN05428948_4637 [Massilia sp. CF038]
MRAVFGAGYQSAANVGLAMLSDYDDRSERSVYYVTPVTHKLLDSGDAVLIVNAQLSSQNEDDIGKAKIDDPLSGHGEPGRLNVFILRAQAGGGWSVIRRHENVAQLGSNGQFSGVQWPMLGTDRPGLAIEHGWMGQGYAIGFLALFDLSDPALPELTPEQSKLYAENEGACDEPKTACWSVVGTWRFDTAAEGAKYKDLVIDFSGAAPELAAKEEEASEEAAEPIAAPEPSTKKIAVTARYKFDGKRYRLASGENPVPDI